MDLTLYDIIKVPRITEKAYRLNNKLKQLVLDVHVEANKPLIAEALKKLFNVEAQEIRVIVRKGKNRRVGKSTVTGRMQKKAIITLKKGYSVDLTGLAQNGAEGQELAQEKAR